MNNTLQPNDRLGVVDALRGFALLAIVVLHNLEHYNIFSDIQGLPDWLRSVDRYVWDTIFFLFAGKAYAIFSLLFGFSFYIQLRNAERRGERFRGRFAWRLLLLMLFAQLHALFYDGDILLLYAVVGFILIPISRLNDRAVFWIALILFLQPYEWGRMLYGWINPDYAIVDKAFVPYAILCEEATKNGTFFEVLKCNIWNGQLYSNIWQVENGRLFQVGALFLFGMLLGRRNYFVKSDTSVRFWQLALRYAAIAFLPLYLLRTLVPDLITNPSIETPYRIAVSSFSNFSMMVLLVSLFTLLWFRNGGYSWQRFIIPFGRMSLTNYIAQSISGTFIYYGFGLGLYNSTGATQTLLIGLLIVLFLWLVSRYWLAHHKQGPLEYLWKKGTWIRW